MRFTKMQGLGNDYIYVYGMPEDPEKLSVKLSDRHFGIGSDGLIVIGPSDKADFSMRIFNADGSEAKMCGNGIRCVGKYVYDKGLTDKAHITVDTLSGIKELDLDVTDGKVKSVRVMMGKGSIPGPVTVCASDRVFRAFPVDMGNPHAVIFVKDAESVPLSSWGPQVERAKVFGETVNAEFVSVIKENVIRMRVWERGSGITMACGTGACASAFAYVREELKEPSGNVEVVLDGGSLFIEVTEDGTVYMTGPAEISFEGETDITV